MINLTKEQAADIYRRDYVPTLFGLIKSQRVATVYFDMVVNAGAKQSTVLLQRALSAMGFQIKADGVFGPKTLDAINDAAPDILFSAFSQQRIAFYHYLVAQNPAQEVFLRGWLRRAALDPQEVRC